jgi:hypothetical protein
MSSIGASESVMNMKAVYNPTIQDIELTPQHTAIMTVTQLQSLVRQSNVEYGLRPEKSFPYHLFEVLYSFNRKEAINFLMVGVGEMFFDAPKDVVLSLVGKYFLGDYAAREESHAN